MGNLGSLGPRHRQNRSVVTMAAADWSGTNVRKSFIDFFKEKGHVNWPSSSVVPVNDPTLLFANAGR